MSEQTILGEDLPAVHVNRFHLTLTDTIARLSFGEIVYGGSGIGHPRAAISLSLSDLAELAGLLNRVLADHAKAIKAAHQKAN